ncbi:MAG TPA: hypothetical protein VHX18_13585 [Rhizomicrobium sp.]|jgi:hypothetical protein|nr:hypothetical protein [Rhizomicrobium sp.]
MRIVNFAAAAAVALGPSVASAQPSKPPFALPPESITVTSVKPSDETISSFVETRNAPTRFLGKMARWRRPVCPLTVGLGDKYAKFVTQRIRDVAAAVGAPVNADPACKPNIEVVFTTTPQAFMDNLRKTGRAFLGYHDSNAQADALAIVTHPIQAWYTTESLDMNGQGQVDSGLCSGPSINLLQLASFGIGGLSVQQNVQLNLTCATAMRWTGSRLSNGYDSGFNNVLVVAEPAKLFDFEVGSLADYITMMGLSQAASLDSCQQLPSISNMLAKGCASAASKITDGDLAYLQGLYRVPTGYSLSGQRDEMRYEMKKILVTDKGN